MKLSESDAKNVMVLRDNPHFRKYSDMLGKLAGDKVDTIIKHDLSDAKLRTAIGEVRMLVEIADSISDADITLKQYESKT